MRHDAQFLAQTTNKRKKLQVFRKNCLVKRCFTLTNKQAINIKCLKILRIFLIQPFYFQQLTLKIYEDVHNRTNQTKQSLTRNKVEWNSRIQLSGGNHVREDGVLGFCSVYMHRKKATHQNVNPCGSLACKWFFHSLFSISNISRIYMY